MDPKPEQRWLDALSEVLNRSHLFQPDQLAPAVSEALVRLGIRTTIYLVDDEQQALRAVPQDGRPASAPIPLDASLPGQVFTSVRSAPVDGDRGWWVPIVNGTDRLGVVEYTVVGGIDPADDLLRRRCETMAGLIGHLITVTQPKGDFLYQVRRSQPMSNGAELLSQMLPPLTSSCERLTISAILEPRYDVGGDGFDYAVDGSFARLMIFDGVGHRLRGGLAYTVALVAIRAARRAGQDLYGQAAAADAALAEEFDDARFVTAVLAELDMDTGIVRYLNAGHPAPLLFRAGRFVRELSGGRRMPLGVGDAEVPIGEERLEPGDRLLLFSDGVTEARNAEGEMFGLQRLIEHAERHAQMGLAAPETLRRLAHAVATHHDGPTADDATLLLAEWSPTAARRTVPDRAGTAVPGT